MTTLRNFILPLERDPANKVRDLSKCFALQDALTKRAAMRRSNEFVAVATRSGTGQDTLRWWGMVGPAKPNAQPQKAPVPTPKQTGTAAVQKPKKPEQTWWPTQTAFDRQRITLGEPFVRKGEVVVVWRDEHSGYIKSRGLGSAPLVRDGKKENM